MSHSKIEYKMISTGEIVGFSIGTVLFASGSLLVLIRYLNRMDKRNDVTTQRSTVRFREDYPDY